MWDPETGLYQYRARYYSRRLGVFLSTDPIGTKDDPNLYLYVGLDPVNATDPTGRKQHVCMVRVSAGRERSPQKISGCSGDSSLLGQSC
ncbi:MAG: RHS repeat-associated core domain-containing protein [Brevundimonas sp.]|nr:MAG: RHS repeat-associated core domain-containing protein [Brevundimonas sp.]